MSNKMFRINQMQVINANKELRAKEIGAPNQISEKPSFTEAKDLSPKLTEYKKYILEYSKTDTLGLRLREEFPDLSDANINKMKGNITEDAMHDYYKKNGWTKIEGEIDGKGIDGLYIKRNKDGEIQRVTIAEAKYGTSGLGETNSGTQMSKEWLCNKLDKLIEKYPDKDYPQIKALVEKDLYKARLFHVHELGDKLYIDMKKIDSNGREVEIKALNGRENYSINQASIDLQNPDEKYKKVAQIYLENVEKHIQNKHNQLKD